MHRVWLFLITAFCLSALHAQNISLLLTAIQNNNITEVERLLQSGSKITETDDDGDGVLQYAALYASPECMKLLLEKGADVHAKNKLGETALITSANNIDKLRLLIQHGADVNAVTNRRNTTLLAACVGNGQREIIQLLLDKGADPKATNDRGETTLMHIALYGDTSIAAQLVKLGVDINQRASNKETALFMSSRTANNEMVRWLLKNGADANMLDMYEAKPLAYAIVVCDLPTVTEMARQTKEINKPDIDGMTLLMWAAYSEEDRPEVIQVLLKNKASTKIKDKKGDTALSWALKKGNTKTAELLKAKTPK